MCWPTNKDKLACFTLFTLFFGGDRFAPLARAAPRARRTGPSSGGDRAAGVDGEPVQGYLQRHYCAAMARLAAALRGEANVVGFGSMNERPARVRARANARRPGAGPGPSAVVRPRAGRCRASSAASGSTRSRARSGTARCRRPWRPWPSARARRSTSASTRSTRAAPPRPRAPRAFARHKQPSGTSCLAL